MALTTRIRATAKKPGRARPSISSLESGPSFSFHRNARGGVTADPESTPSPEMGGIRTRKSLDTSWITPLRRPDGESRSRRGCLEKYSRRRRFMKIFNEGENATTEHIQLEPGVGKLNKGSEDNSYVHSTLCALVFGQFANSEG